MHFIGTKPVQLCPLIDALNLDEDVTIHSGVDASDVRHELQRYDFLYLNNPIPMHESPLVATKTFDYFAACLPIIADLPDGDQARIVSRAKAGWVTPPGDHEALVKVFDKVIANGSQPHGYIRQTGTSSICSQERIRLMILLP